jgi:diguanylate cyclase (GGDEF)-like protein
VTRQVRLPAASRVFDGVLLVLGLCVLVTVIVRHEPWDAFEWPLLAVIPVVALLGRFPMVLPKRQYGVEIGLDVAVLVLLAMSATGADAMLIWALATVPVQLSRSKSFATRFFNGALSLIAGTAAILAMGAVAPMGRTGPAEVAAVLFGGAVYFLVDYVCTAVSIALASGDSLYSVMFSSTLPMALAGLLAVTCLGWLGAITLRYAPVGLPLVAVPLIAVIAAMRAVTISSRERLRLGLLFETSLASQAAATADDVEEVLLSRAGALLRCEQVTLGTVPPDGAAGEIGACLGVGQSAPAGAAQWLVAARRTSEEPYDDADSKSLSTLATVGVESLRRAELTAAMTRMARHDSLTGLDNRSVLRERLEAAIAWADSRRSAVAVIYIDLDGFKTVNDTLGHDGGDELLLQVAHRLRAGVRAGDTVARMGGDEFAVLVESVKALEVVHATAHRLLAAISEPFEVRGEPVQVGASVGYTVRDGTEDVTELLQRADIAMYAVKESGKHGVAAFTPEMFSRRSARAQLQQELSHAVRKGELRVHLQPVVFLSNGQIDGAEALVRWQHPTRGLLGPVEFIDVAEESGLIEEIGLWVLHQSWADAERLGAQLGRPISLAVNVASGQLSGSSLVDAVTALPSGGFYPTLVVEVTERDLVDDPASTQTLLALRALGVHIAVDDFGTGYSSFAYLRTLPVDIVKLDRQFIVDAADDPRAIGVIRAVTAMALALGLVTIAEGVETREQADLVTAAGCLLAQGYLFARPMPVDDLIATFTAAAV